MPSGWCLQPKEVPTKNVVKVDDLWNFIEIFVRRVMRRSRFCDLEVSTCL